MDTNQLTDEYEEIEISIKDLIDTYGFTNTDVQIESPDGWVDIECLYDKDVQRVFKVSLEDGASVRCAYNHRVEIYPENHFSYSENLKIGDLVRTNTGYSKVSEVYEIDSENVYDMSVGHVNERYYAQGISHHNTAGSGKTTLARIFAKAINCKSPVNGEPCEECEHCILFNKNSYSDYLEFDGGETNQPEQILPLAELAKTYPNMKGGFRIIVIDEAHRLTPKAWDILLKPLEEGSKRTIWIFATTEPNNIRPAIISRSYIHVIKPLSVTEIKKEITRVCDLEGIGYDSTSINLISSNYRGKMRDALKVLDMYGKAKGTIVGLTIDNNEEMLLEVIKRAFMGKVQEAIEHFDSSLNISLNIYKSLGNVVFALKFYGMLESGYISKEIMDNVTKVLTKDIINDISKMYLKFNINSEESFKLMLNVIAEKGLTVKGSGTSNSNKRERRTVRKNLANKVGAGVNARTVESTQNVKEEASSVKLINAGFTTAENLVDETSGKSEAKKVNPKAKPRPKVKQN